MDIDKLNNIQVIAHVTAQLTDPLSLLDNGDIEYLKTANESEALAFLQQLFYNAVEDAYSLWLDNSTEIGIAIKNL